MEEYKNEIQVELLLTPEEFAVLSAGCEVWNEANRIRMERWEADTIAMIDPA